MKDEPDSQWFSVTSILARWSKSTMSAVLEYYDAFPFLVIRDCNHGGNAKNTIIQADVTLRTEIFRLNDTNR